MVNIEDMPPEEMRDLLGRIGFGLLTFAANGLQNF